MQKKPKDKNFTPWKNTRRLEEDIQKMQVKVGCHWRTCRCQQHPLSLQRRKRLSPQPLQQHWKVTFTKVWSWLRKTTTKNITVTNNPKFDVKRWIVNKPTSRITFSSVILWKKNLFLSFEKSNSFEVREIDEKKLCWVKATEWDSMSKLQLTKD